MTRAEGAVIELLTVREEGWRSTPGDEIAARLGTAIPARGVAGSTVSRRLLDALAGTHGGSRLVFVNGFHAAPLSDHERLPSGLAAHAGHGLATVVVAPMASIPDPVHIVHLASPDAAAAAAGRDTMSCPGTLIEVGDGSRVSVIESYCGGDGPTATDASTTIRVGRHATVDHYRIQTESSTGVHVGHTRIDQAEGSRLRTTVVTLGGGNTRTAIAVRFTGAGAATDLAGVTLTTGHQRHDTVVTVDHAVTRCASTQRFTGVVNDHGKASFSGEILVRPGADGTEAHQFSNNLVLSPHAEADSRPWLQIFTDDVRCTHGATVGRLDDDALFYLCSRGIPAATAREMLISAFVHAVTDRVPHESLREQVAAAIAASSRLDVTGRGEAG